MISFKNKFLFIHIPKTGGNSIQNILREYSEDEIVTPSKHQDGHERFEVRNANYKTTKHSTLSVYHSLLKSDVYKGLYKFATIRNPWDRMVSFYFSPHRGREEWNREEFMELIQKVSPIQDYLGLLSPMEKFRKKMGFCVTPRNYTHNIDFLIRFENLQEDFNNVCDKLNIPKKTLPRRNTSSRKHYYDKELIELVENQFHEEIRIGNYHFDR